MTYRDAESSIVVVAFQGRVFGLRRTSGRKVWEHRFDLDTIVRVRVRAGRVFAISSSLTCLDLATGALLWSAQLSGALFSGTLLVDGDQLIIGDSGMVASYDVVSGAPLWVNRFEGEREGHVALAREGEDAQADT
jgi:outer membrane protein assembly factor BamB